MTESYSYDSSIKRYSYPVSYTSQTDSIAANDSTSLQVYGANLPEADQAQQEETKTRNFDIDKLVKKYKDDPSKILDELGINFTEEQKKELESLIKDKKSLRSFLNIAQNKDLNAADIFEGMKKTVGKKASGIFSRIKNVVKTMFKEGFDEAVELAKSETAYYADQLGENMQEIRAERKEFSSANVADIADVVTINQEIKDDVMHFVQKENTDGSHLYTEQDVTKATEILEENPDDADNFTANAAELESIKTTNGQIKYKGSTIIDVDEKMIKNKDVQSTMMDVAKKSDMTDKYLIETTSNLAKNHDMADAISFLVKAKDKDGKDKFRAVSIVNESKYLVSKSRKNIERYIEDVRDFIKHEKLSGDNVLDLVHTTTANPDIKNSVIEKINNSNLSGNEIVEFAASASQNTQHENNISTIKESVNYDAQIIEPENNSTIVTNPVRARKNEETNKFKFQIGQNFKTALNTQTENETATINGPTTVIYGKTYERSKVLNGLYKRFGTISEKILQKMEEDPNFIEIMKQYNGNTTILTALVNDPTLVTKIKKASASISINEMADVIKQCTDSSSTRVMINALESHNPAEAIAITKKSKIFNLKDDTIAILSRTNANNSDKKSELESLYQNGGKKREIMG